MALSNKPSWTDHQQKKGVTKTREQKSKESKTEAKTSLVKVFMTSNYRDIVKNGEVFETDGEKAAELIRLKRAVAYDVKKHKNAVVKK